MQNNLSPHNSSDTGSCFILVVDDSEDATFLLRRLLKKAGVNGPVEHVPDGEAAICFLEERMKPGGCMPLFILLDVNMPKKSGFEVLHWIRSQPQLEDLVVIMVSTSGEEPEVKKAYELGVDCYLIKNPDSAVFTHIYAVAIEIKSRRKKRAEAGEALSRYSVKPLKR
jgi:CheY-like chemotaxis protein